MRKKRVQPKKRRLFECITEKQTWKIETLLNELKDFNQAKFDAMLIDLTGLPFIVTLSKQEASFIIDELAGHNKRERPFPSKTEDQIKEDPDQLPLIGQILFIRESVKSFQWSEERFNQWLRDYIKVDNFRSLNRETAQKAYRMLVKRRQYSLTAWRIQNVIH